MFFKSRSKLGDQSWAEYFAAQQQACNDSALQAYYAHGIPDPMTPIGEVPMMALDFETTGMDPAKHAIVSIGMVPFDLQRIRPAKGRYWVVKPARSLREESILYHRITHSEIEHAPDLDVILDEILEQIAGHIVVVHYHRIERPFLDGAILARRGEHGLFPIIDTMNIEARFERRQRFAWLKRLFGRQPLSIRLAASRQRYGLPLYSAHHAKVDALATAELLQAQIARHYSPQTPVGDLWL